MSLRKQRIILKLTELEISPSTRREIIESILKKKKKTTRLYAWKVDSKKIAEEAFLTKNDAVKNWYLTKRVWEQEEEYPGVLMYSWEASPEEFTKYIQAGKVVKIPLGEEAQNEVVTPPSTLHKDIQNTLKARSLEKQ